MASHTCPTVPPRGYWRECSKIETRSAPLGFSPMALQDNHIAQKSRAVDREPLFLAQVEPTVHVPACLEGRNNLFGHRDLGAIARVSSRARVPPLDREH